MNFHPAVPRHRFKPRSHEGFTLIELIVVMVIIGILAAFAIPRFADVNKDARAAAIRSLAGSFRSSSALVHGLALARNTAPDGTVTLEGESVQLAGGYPAATAGGIGKTVVNTDGFVGVGESPIAYYPATLTASTSANCRVTYTGATGSTPPQIVLLDTDC